MSQQDLHIFQIISVRVERREAPRARDAAKQTDGTNWRTSGDDATDGFCGEKAATSNPFVLKSPRRKLVILEAGGGCVP